MGISCGIVGLPNVGKSTLFNALTATQAAEAANFPFCTIEPNVGIVAVPDERLEKLTHIAGSKKIIPTQLEFVDIAGLVKGASKGEGLGNQFLGNIREVDAIIHVLRCFEDEDITHVSGNVDPIRDAEVIELELILADLDSLQKRIPNFEKKIRGQDKEAAMQLELAKKIIPILEEGKPVRSISFDPEELKQVKLMQLLTAKPILFVANVLEEEAASGNDYTARVLALAQAHNTEMVIISSKIEAEISTLESLEEKQEFLESLGLKETGLNKIIRAAYKMLGLISFFTVGPKEAHAWTVKNGATAPQAAGEIHTDFEKGFIRAETISYADFIQYNGEAGCKEVGKMKLEGKEYLVKDGDIFHFRFNV
ncbi:redox-regulated ATPase YchF [Rickettsiales endosymbiont of Stachyamoeba lipophora]|uniref:redox-regulated ATPase YchF n=1 Tax=Rickettsiales endosymbiont of Stachyamoeba lipophora TaxID=2486578 RepID=UPI000F64C802|nr:redox-regulated ATPase YchF [Rickettsiales endosymbiont of Stachyamoeba lipophora]AZL15526.1 redox-regulated ATPase YchF [Rickettsiales endosymbiont of Stachyamoeba lipophora]